MVRQVRADAEEDNRVNISSEYYLDTCITCGIHFAVPMGFERQRRDDGRSYHCPNGHSQRYTETTASRLEKEKAQLERTLQAKLNEAHHARLVAERERDKAVKDKRKVERRIAHGVCPCCNKTFADLSQHMVTEHKDFRLPAGKQTKRIEGAA